MAITFFTPMKLVRLDELLPTTSSFTSIPSLLPRKFHKNKFCVQIEESDFIHSLSTDTLHFHLLTNKLKPNVNSKQLFVDFVKVFGLFSSSNQYKCKPQCINITSKYTMVYSYDEIVDILLTLGECRSVYRAAVRLYRRRYPQRLRHPSHEVIRQIERNCRRGRIAQRPRQPRVVPDDPRVLTVLAMVHMDPHISVRQIERDSGIPRETARRIVRSRRYHPYHITLTQALSAEDRENRVKFCHWALQRLNEDPDFFRYVLFSDEATFQSTGALNRHNSHYWAQENPRWTQHIDHQHRWSVNVWCGIVDGQVVGPHFFNGTVNSENYLQFLQDELPVLLENVPLQTRERMWLQQDGAPQHFALCVRNYLNVSFHNRWIGRGGYVVWLSRSPDLTPLNFHLWGYIKDVVYQNRPTTPVDMQRKIREAIARVTPLVLQDVI